mmetsp:Transcript_8088/g.24183  ORF Transcript_8088/g.24183 Transcript_8088/m.24183 type:complete len:440 (-) Transcript_8088:8-1327(-)
MGQRRGPRGRARRGQRRRRRRPRPGHPLWLPGRGLRRHRLHRLLPGLARVHDVPRLLAAPPRRARGAREEATGAPPAGGRRGAHVRAPHGRPVAGGPRGARAPAAARGRARRVGVPRGLRRGRRLRAREQHPLRVAPVAVVLGAGPRRRALRRGVPGGRADRAARPPGAGGPLRVDRLLLRAPAQLDVPGQRLRFVSGLRERVALLRGRVPRGGAQGHGPRRGARDVPRARLVPPGDVGHDEQAGRRERHVHIRRPAAAHRGPARLVRRRAARLRRQVLARGRQGEDRRHGARPLRARAAPRAARGRVAALAVRGLAPVRRGLRGARDGHGLVAGVAAPAALPALVLTPGGHGALLLVRARERPGGGRPAPRRGAARLAQVVRRPGAGPRGPALRGPRRRARDGLPRGVLRRPHRRPRAAPRVRGDRVAGRISIVACAS